MRMRKFNMLVPAVLVAALTGCGGDSDPTSPPPPTGPQDLSGSYSLQSYTSALTGGITLTPPTVSGTMQVTQTGVTGGVASGTVALSVRIPDGAGGVREVDDTGAYTQNQDGTWAQTGNLVQGAGTYTLAGNVLTIVVTDPAASASNSVWQKS